MTKHSRAKKQHHQARHAAHETARAAEQNFEHATRAGQKVTEQAMHWWYRMMSGAGWQKQIERLNEAAESVMPLAQRNWDEWLELLRNSNQAGTEFVRKTIETARTPLANGKHWVDWWSSAAKTAQNNFAAATQFGTCAVDFWTEFLRRNAQTAAETTGQAA